MTEYIFDPSQWTVRFEGITSWMRPWIDCPCGSIEHQAGGHPLDQIDVSSFYRERTQEERRHSRVVRRWELKHTCKP